MLPSLDAIAAEPALAAGLERDDVVVLMAKAAALQAVLAVRLAAMPTRAPAASDTSDGDIELVDAEHVARLLGLKSARGAYALARRMDWRPIVVRVSRRALRFKVAALRVWIAKRGGRAAA